MPTPRPAAPSPAAPSLAAPAPAAPPDARPAYARTGLALGRAVLAFLLAAVLVVTLAPFAFARPGAVRVVWWAADATWGGWFDVLANVLFFVPLGFVGALTRGAVRGPAADAAPAWRRAAWAAGAGAALSAVVEAAQCFAPARVPSPTDVLTNAAGAWLGAWACERASAALGAGSPLVGRLALELPIVGSVYLAMPWLTLAALAGSADAGGAGALRDAALVAAGAFGGVLVGTVQGRHLGPRGVAGPGGAAAVAAGWYAAGAFPAVGRALGAYACGALLAAAAAWLVGRESVGAARGAAGGADRRYEAEAVGRAAPWLVAALGLSALAGPDANWGRAAVVRDLEQVAGCTLLGYLLAEWWGRRPWGGAAVVWRLTAAAAAGAAALGALEWAGGPLGAWLARAAVRAAAAVYGGWLYHLQRAHVRALVDARRTLGAEAVPARLRAPRLRAPGRPPRESAAAGALRSR